MNDTIAALATPPGEAALAVVRVSGSQVRNIVAQALGGHSPTLSARTARVGEYFTVDGVLLDQVVWIYYEGPRSYTGEDMLEIMPHGSPFIVQRLLEDLSVRDCRLAEPGEFTRLAFLNGKMDLAQAEAIIDVIRARSDRALAAAQKQLAGVLGQRINELVTDLLKTTAQIEAYIDFPDEDLPAENVEGPIRSLLALREQIGGLMATEHYRQRLQDGIRIVLVGEPNAGKSSLLNILVESDRAIVSEEAGTTRDFIEVRTLFGGHLVRLFDTAGIRKSDSRVERAGVAKTLEVAHQADLLLFVHDISQPWPLPDSEIQALIAEKPCIGILHKSDLLTGGSSDGEITFSLGTLQVSSSTGSGISDLRKLLQKYLDRDFQVPADADVVISARHATALAEAKLSLESAVAKLRAQEPTELAATDLHIAIEAMGRIVGRIDNERVLDELFGAFCIGK